MFTIDLFTSDELGNWYIHLHENQLTCGADIFVFKKNAFVPFTIVSLNIDEQGSRVLLFFPAGLHPLFALFTNKIPV